MFVRSMMLHLIQRRQVKLTHDANKEKHTSGNLVSNPSSRGQNKTIITTRPSRFKFKAL